MQVTEHKAQQPLRMTVALTAASVGLSVFSLALGFALTGLWSGTVAVVAAGAMWMLGQLRRAGQAGALAWISSTGLVVMAIASAMAMMYGVGGGWSVLCLVAALVAWDLDQFAQRVRVAGRVDDLSGQEQHHIRRVLAVAGIGGLLGIVGLVLRVRLAFGLALLLAALVIVCLSLVIGYMRRAGD